MDGMAMLNVILGVFFQYQVQLQSLLGLVILDVVLGVSSAIKAKNFDWLKIATFYHSTVLPMILGWIGFVVATYLVGPGVLGAASDIVSPVTANATYAAVVASLLASIAKSGSEVLGIALNLPGLQVKKKD